MSEGTDRVGRLAELAMLRLDADERATLEEQLDRILRYIEQLEELPIDNVARTKHAVAADNIERDDEPRPSLPRDEALDQAPAVEDGEIAVPRVLPT